jgi:hypothetical protein
LAVALITGAQLPEGEPAQSGFFSTKNREFRPATKAVSTVGSKLYLMNSRYRLRLFFHQPAESFSGQGHAKNRQVEHRFGRVRRIRRTACSTVGIRRNRADMTNINHKRCASCSSGANGGGNISYFDGDSDSTAPGSKGVRHHHRSPAGIWSRGGRYVMLRVGFSVRKPNDIIRADLKLQTSGFRRVVRAADHQGY